MEFIGTEVGIKIRSAIKAKLTELGKTVDDELIDYIMVMVANKKEEIQMTRDLQPFLESDTLKFTSWLHKVLQKLEQVTVIVTDEEFKIATTAFNKVNKKRKSTETSVKKKSSSKDEPKEKKKKIKHEHSTKHSKNTAGIALDGASKTSIKDSLKPKSIDTATGDVVGVGKAVKVKKSKTVSVSEAKDVPTISDATVKSTKVSLGKEPEGDKKSSTFVAAKSSSKVQAVTPVQKPVMMVSDDDDDDDDFINIKTDVAEEDDLLDEEKAQRSAAVVTTDTPDIVVTVSDKKESSPVAATVSKTQAVVAETDKPNPVKAQPVKPAKPAKLAVVEEAVSPPVAAPRSVVSTVVSTVSSSSRRNFKRQTSSRTESPPAQKSRPPILSRIGAVLKRKANHLNDEEEEEESKNGTVASVVKVKPRPMLPAKAQAPKNLLLRAMADAHRSVATAPVREEPEPPPKSRSPLFTRKFRDNNQQERIAVTLPNIRDPSDEAVEIEEEDEHTDKDENLDLMQPDEAYVPELVTSPSLALDVMYSPSPISKTGAQMAKSDNGQGSKRCATPEFLVTLDGYKNYSSLSRTIMCDPEREEQDMEHEQERQEEEDCSEQLTQEKPARQKIVFTSKPGDEDKDELMPGKNAPPKSLDRCKFWPACRLGDSCTFHHPTQTCKAFPGCQFGDRCLYIHPNCKFDASCTRKDCPYTHASPRNLTSIAAVVPIAPRPVSQRLGPQLTCRFFPNCSNTNCRFYHPKPCRYGRQCSKPDCTFTHSEFPPKAKMKWVSSM